MANFFKRAPKPGADVAAAHERRAPSKIEEIRPDPDRIGISGSVPFVRLPAPGTLFTARAARFRTLAADHPLGGYLAFLARVAEAQAAVQAARAADGAAIAELAPADLAMRAEHGMPALPRTLLSDDPAFGDILERVLARLDLAEAPAAARAARDALAAAAPEERIDLGVQIFEGALPVERMAECVYVSAALQVFLAEHAALLDPKGLKPVADGVCPACGGAPCASLIVSWTPADKARYLACTQCGTLWNHVRIRCTACGSGEDVTYFGLDEVSKDVQVEACGSCHSYLKHLHQHRDPALDPVADDVASYGLDLKIAEDGFRKAGLNLLFVG